MPEIKLINPTTYEVTMPLGDMVEIGDKDSPDFKQHLKLNRWNGECAIDLGFDTVRKILPILQPDRLTWDDGSVACEFIPQPPSKRDKLGGFKFNIILKKKPKTNISTLKFKAKGLKFYYQPALTPEEIAEGCIRPDNVIGSYAVYHATRTNMHRSQADAEKYKCGKAFHWYRPLIWDSSSPRKEVWGELNVDSAKGIRTVTIPQEFLDSAVYPVTIDDIFGYTTEGGSWNLIEDYIRGSTYAGAIGTLDNVKAYIKSEAGSHEFKLGVYRDSDGVLVFGSGIIDSGNTSGGWITATAGSEALTAIDYNLVGWSDSGFSYIAYDEDAAVEYVWYQKTFNGWPSPCAFSSSTNKKHSIYCTYTPGIAPPAAVTPWNLAPRMAMMIGSH